MVALLTILIPILAMATILFLVIDAGFSVAMINEPLNDLTNILEKDRT